MQFVCTFRGLRKALTSHLLVPAIYRFFALQKLERPVLSPANFIYLHAAAIHYSPCIDQVIVCALYHEGRWLRRTMTRLVNDLLTASLQDRNGLGAGLKCFARPLQLIKSRFGGVEKAL